MSAKHTPGPWVVQGPFELASGGEALAISADGIDVALVTYNGTDEEKAACRADAQLLSAAPDLLEALEEILENPDPRHYHAPVIRKFCRLAIAKARGGK